MERIRIGICIPGDRLEEKLPWAIAAGFESVSVAFKAPLVHKVDLQGLGRQVKRLTEDTGMTVAAIGCYGNPLESRADREALEQVIDAAPEFGTDLVGTFAGACSGKPLEDSIPVFRTVFGELEKRVSAAGLRLAFENCLQGGSFHCVTQNIAFHPRAWELMFEALPSESLGLEWEPAHQIAQLIDPIGQLKRWAPRIFHVHGKDGRTDWEAIRLGGVHGPGYIAQFSDPGRGETDWRQVFLILSDNGFHGSISLECGGDPAYAGARQQAGELRALDYLGWCRDGM